MEAVTVWKFLHIASMFVAVSIFVGQGMLSGVVARSGDVRALRWVLAAEDRFGPAGTPPPWEVVADPNEPPGT